MASSSVVGIDNNQMTEKTLQWVIIIFAFAVGLVALAVTGTFCVIVVRDGNDPLVQQAFTDLAALAQNAFYAIAMVIVGKPVASGILQFLQGKSIQASTQNIPAVPSTIGVSSLASTKPDGNAV